MAVRDNQSNASVGKMDPGNDNFLVNLVVPIGCGQERERERGRRLCNRGYTECDCVLLLSCTVGRYGSEEQQRRRLRRWRESGEGLAASPAAEERIEVFL